MRRGRGRLAALALLIGAVALGAAGAFPARADPTEEEPGASGDPHYREGKRAIERADWQRAVALLAAAARRDARNADIHNYLGFAYRHVGDFAAAFAHYDEALRLNPRHRGAHEYAGEAALMLNDLIEPSATWQHWRRSACCPAKNSMSSAPPCPDIGLGYYPVRLTHGRSKHTFAGQCVQSNRYPGNCQLVLPGPFRKVLSRAWAGVLRSRRERPLKGRKQPIGRPKNIEL